MAAGREVDALVAERVMGLVPCTAESHRSGEAPWSCHARGDSPDQGGETAHFSTDMDAAWPVVEAMQGRGFVFTLRYRDSGGWRACFMTRPTTENRSPSRVADTAPLAICRAALAAVEAR